MSSGRELRYLVRPGPTDHLVLDRLLTPSLEEPDPLKLDGVVLDASHAQRFREMTWRFGQVLVDHQTYRLQHAGCQDIPSLMALPYSPPDGPYRPEHFAMSPDVSRFVQSVLDLQHGLRVTHFLAPTFYCDSADSPWSAVNDELLRESIRQADGQVYATVCGSHSVLCKRSSEEISFRLANSGAIGVYVLISPLAATSDSVSKLVAYVELLSSLRDQGLEVIAARQPAFGLGLLSLGIAGFDSGIAQTERFDFASLVRFKRRAGRKGTGRKSRRVYIANLMSSLPADLARCLLTTSGLAGSYICQEVCCRDGSTRAVMHSREHFLGARLKEVQDIRDRPKQWRARHYAERLARARQLGDRLGDAFPDRAPAFTHLDTWARVIRVFDTTSQRASRSSA